MAPKETREVAQLEAAPPAAALAPATPPTPPTALTPQGGSSPPASPASPPAAGRCPPARLAGRLPALRCVSASGAAHPRFLCCGPLPHRRFLSLDVVLRVLAFFFITCGLVGILSVPGYFAYVYVFEGIFCLMTASLSVAIGVAVEMAVYRKSRDVMRLAEYLLLAKLIVIASGTVVAIILFPRVTVPLWTLIVLHSKPTDAVDYRGEFGGLSILPLILNVAMYTLVYYLFWSFTVTDTQHQPTDLEGSVAAAPQDCPTTALAAASQLV